MVTVSRIKVLLVDDHTMVRQAVHALLQSFPDLDVVGEASDGAEAIFRIGSLQPSVVVMDLTMPKMDWIAATRLIQAQYPNIAVVGLSANAQGYQVESMCKAGAVEVLTKDNAADQLYEAIKKASGEAVHEEPSASK